MAPQKVLIVGAGPVGALAGLYFSYGGWDVEIYELRGDPRLPINTAANIGKSINLALSERGINGMRHIGDGEKLLNKVLAETIPMVGRMIHSGKLGEEGMGQNYDIHGRFIRSADRARLNVQLLDELDERENVKIFFEHKLESLMLEDKQATFQKKTENGESEIVTAEADLIVGSDGAHSKTRQLLQKHVPMYYEQVYIDTLWCEFNIPPHPETGDFQLSPNHLHIWPKQTYMFIAIPSNDKSFTCTLFMSETLFNSIGDCPDELISFFRENFEDVVEMIGEEKLIKQYLLNAKLPLISVKCSPYHYKDRCVIIGDAAHAMVPFYGQGMNAGFEDVRILFSHISSPLYSDLSSALSAYSANRQPDAHTINDLAMKNFHEMRASVTSKVYLVRKWVEESLYRFLPGLGVRTQYSMVSFENLGYGEVVKQVERQSWWENLAAGAFVTGMAIGVVVGRRGESGLFR
ncbi:kynurenine 3-monooxygenase, mitochondrial precursor [Rhizina undulata]